MRPKAFFGYLKDSYSLARSINTAMVGTGVLSITYCAVMLILYYFDVSLPIIVIVSMSVALVAVVLYRWWKLYRH